MERLLAWQYLIRKQVNTRLEGLIHDTCMKRVYAQLTYTYTRCDISYMMLRLAPTIHCILTSKPSRWQPDVAQTLLIEVPYIFELLKKKYVQLLHQTLPVAKLYLATTRNIFILAKYGRYSFQHLTQCVMNNLMCLWSAIHASLIKLIIPTNMVGLNSANSIQHDVLAKTYNYKVGM